MTVLAFTALAWLGSLAAGFIGSLTGLGGGVVIVPLLVLVFGVDIHYAIGASLVSVIATSSGAAAVYVREGYSNIRVGMFLEVATTIGALSGAVLAAGVPANGLAVVFGFILLWSAYLSSGRTDRTPGEATPDRWAGALRLDSTYPTAGGPQHYYVQAVPTGFTLMYAAGMLSGLLGIGSGAVKVLAMDHAMRLPFKVSTTTAYHVFRGEPGDLRLVRGIVSDALELRGRGLIQLGLLLLIATPIARVVFSVATFIRQRDWLYVGITIIVLALLTYSLAGS